MITIGLLTYKRIDDIVSTINEFSNSKLNNIELIIVDNNEVSFEDQILSSITIPSGWSLKYEHDGMNKGVAGGRNVIFNKASGDIMIFLDDDVSIDNIDEVILKTQDYFKSDNNIGALSYKILDYKNKTVNRFEFPHKDKKKDKNKNFYTYYYIGAGHAISRKCFDTVGQYSENRGLYGMEEVEFSYNAINKGYKILYCSDIIIQHKRSPEGRFANEIVAYNAFHNKSLLAARHLKFRFFSTHLLAWSVLYFRKTKNIKNVLQVYKKAVNTRLKQYKEYKFSESFYVSCKKLEAWLWW